MNKLREAAQAAVAAFDKHGYSPLTVRAIWNLRDALAAPGECKQCQRMWDEGRDWQAKAGGWWPADQAPSTAGLYVVRDTLGNVEVAVWLCDWNGKNGEWTRELRDVDRDNIVGWMRVPEFS